MSKISGARSKESAVQPTDQTVPPDGGVVGVVGRWVLFATILGSAMNFIDGTVVNVALPVLQVDLHATVADVQWVIEAYTLFLAALILVGGSLGDRYGRRLVFGVGIVLFTVASVWCGLSPDVGQLVAARALQGVGGALLVPGSLSIITATFSGAERGRAIGTWAGFTTITSALGPVLGGFLISQVSWRWIFFINVPLSAIVLAVLFIKVPESKDEEAGRSLDWAGALLVTLGLGALVYGLIEWGNRGSPDVGVVLALFVGVLMLALFIIVEARSKTPMMPLGIFRSRDFSGTNALTLLLYGALGGTLFFLPFNLIQVQGYSPLAAGAAMLPLVLILSTLSRWSGGLLVRYGARFPLTVGPAIAALGFALFALPGVGGSYWTTFFPAAAVLGIGMAITVAPLTTTVMNSAPSRYSGLASGINNAVSRAAGLLAIAVLGIVALVSFNSNLDSRLSLISVSPTVRQAIDSQRVKLAAIEIPRDISSDLQMSLKRAVDEAFVDSFRLIMLIGGGLALASAVIAFISIGGVAISERKK